MSLRKNFWVVPVALMCLTAFTVQMGAQTTPVTCTVAPTAVSSLSIESVVKLTNVLTTLTPAIPANVLAAITSGAQEIRSRIIYNPGGNTVTTTIFLVAPGAPNPTPVSIDVTGATVESFALNVDRVYTSCLPLPSVMFVGTIGGSGGSFGSSNAAPAAVSIGFTTDTPSKVNNVVELIAGEVVLYSASANGTVTFPAPLLTPPVTPTGNPTIVFGPGVSVSSVNQVFFNPLTIDVSGSTDPAKLALTYSFTSTKAIDFKPSASSPTPTLYFDAGPGDYVITVTVTNSAGLSSSQNINVQYTGK